MPSVAYRIACAIGTTKQLIADLDWSRRPSPWSDSGSVANAYACDGMWEHWSILPKSSLLMVLMSLEVGDDHAKVVQSVAILALAITSAIMQKGA
eukprot:2976002-Ditylum_brightwellii.AAC.1